MNEINLNIFIPKVGDTSVIDDYVLPLIREAIGEGAFYYPYHIEKHQTDKAALVFTYLFSKCVRDKTFALALDATSSVPLGFESYSKSPFCDYFKTNPVYNVGTTFVSSAALKQVLKLHKTFIRAGYRKQGVASRLRRFLFKKGNFSDDTTFCFCIQKNNAAGYLSVDKLVKELNMSMVETGVTYEGQLTHQLDI